MRTCNHQGPRGRNQKTRKKESRTASSLHTQQKTNAKKKKKKKTGRDLGSEKTKAALRRYWEKRERGRAGENSFLSQ